MENQFYELRSKHPLSSLVGTYLLRIEKEGVQYSIEGLIGKIANPQVLIPWENIERIEVQQILWNTDFVVFSNSGKSFKVPNVEKSAAKNAKELILKLQKEHQSKPSQNLQNVSIPNNPNIDLVDQLEKLSKLKDSGILTQEEFDEQKTKLLSKM